MLRLWIDIESPPRAMQAHIPRSELQYMLHKGSLTLYWATYPFHSPLAHSFIHSVALPSYLSYHTEAAR